MTTSSSGGVCSLSSKPSSVFKSFICRRVHQADFVIRLRRVDFWQCKLALLSFISSFHIKSTWRMNSQYKYLHRSGARKRCCSLSPLLWTCVTIGVSYSAGHVRTYIPSNGVGKNVMTFTNMGISFLMERHFCSAARRQESCLHKKPDDAYFTGGKFWRLNA